MSRKRPQDKSPTNAEQPRNRIETLLNSAISYLVSVRSDPLKTDRIKSHHIKSGAEAEIKQSELPIIINRIKTHGYLQTEIENQNRNLYRITDKLPAEDELPIAMQTGLDRFFAGGDDE